MSAVSVRARLAGLDEVPVLVKDVSDQAAAAMALIENIQREDLNPLEEAHGIQRLLDEFGFTHEQAAESVGRSRSAVSNLLRLLNLASPVQTMLLAGDLDMGHARALLAVDAATQITLAHQVVNKRMSVRETEKLVTHTTKEAPAVKARAKDDGGRDTRRLEEELSDLLASTVKIAWPPRARAGDDRLRQPRRARRHSRATAWQRRNRRGRRMAETDAPAPRRWLGWLAVASCYRCSCLG